MKRHINSPRDPRWAEVLPVLVQAASSATVIWDFDGVLADSEPVHAESYRRLLLEMGDEPEPDFFVPCIGHSEPVIWKMLVEAGYTVSGSLDERVARRRAIYLGLASEQLQPSWVARTLLPVFQGVADIQQVISAGDPRTIEHLLREWDLDRYLDYEPSDSPKQEQLDRAWSSGATVTIEDNIGYLEKARAAGSFTVRIDHGMSSPAERLEVDVELGI